MQRFYRKLISDNDLVNFSVSFESSDLFISADKDLSRYALKLTTNYRKIIQGYITKHPEFEKSLRPVKTDPSAPEIIKDMIRQSLKVDVGPMASVAGAVAEYIGKDLLNKSKNIIVENGGDIFLVSKKSRIVGIYAGKSVLSNKIGVKIKNTQIPCGVCTSSGTVGHSLSFGKADAVVVFSKSCVLADATATAVCNLVKKKENINSAMEFVKDIKDIFGVVIIYDDNMGSWGDIQMVDLKR